jgi:microcystin-dependent protein
MDAFVGQIMSFGFSFAPQGWFPCDGRLLSISNYEVLYTLIGTTYGGDGVNSFQLPDLRGRVPIHIGQGPALSNYVLAQKGGAEQVTLLPANMPPHTHAVTVTAGAGNAGVISPVTASLNATTASALTVTAAGTLLGGGHQAYVAGTTTPVAPMASNALAVTGSLPLPRVTVNNNGGSIPVPVVQSYLAVSYCICWAGIYPTQN